MGHVTHPNNCFSISIYIQIVYATQNSEFSLWLCHDYADCKLNDFEFLLFMKAFLFLCNKIMSLLFHADVKVTSIDNVRQTILNFDYQNISKTIIIFFG